ncbi:MAG: hypothetical protein F6J92_38005 [Symploca sp. SIO1A3]|nr:hypothetical protein [Symploca sp. SIO1A3]
MGNGQRNVFVLASGPERVRPFVSFGIAPCRNSVAHLYVAKPDLANHYRTCDPTNSFNPGIGKMSRCKHYV